MKKHSEGFKVESVRIALTSCLSQRRVAADLSEDTVTLHLIHSRQQYRAVLMGPMANAYRMRAMGLACKTPKPPDQHSAQIII